MDTVTCDACEDTDESGWGDTPLCLTCQREADPSLVCEDHDRTFEDTCPLCDTVNVAVTYTFWVNVPKHYQSGDVSQAVSDYINSVGYALDNPVNVEEEA